MQPAKLHWSNCFPHSSCKISVEKSRIKNPANQERSNAISTALGDRVQCIMQSSRHAAATAMSHMSVSGTENSLLFSTNCAPKAAVHGAPTTADDRLTGSTVQVQTCLCRFQVVPPNISEVASSKTAHQPFRMSSVRKRTDLSSSGRVCRIGPDAELFHRPDNAV